jgi:hypothetical protein
VTAGETAFLGVLSMSVARELVRAGNADVWLLGRPRVRGGFAVRYVSWSLSYAHEIVRDGEQIRRGVVMVVNNGPARGRPRKDKRSEV